MAVSTGAIKAGRAFVELFADDSAMVRGLRRAQAKLKAFGASVSRIGRTLIAGSLVAAVPFGLSAQVFANFEQRMARVQALTGAVGQDFEALEAEAKRLGATTVFSASQAAEAMSFFALAGFDVQQILTAIGPTLKLASAGQLEIAEAADITAKIMAGMGIEAENVGEAVDVLTKAMTTANTDLLQLGDAMKFVGPIAKSAGKSLEETVAIIQALSNAGIQAEMAGTSLRGILLALTSPSKEAQGVMKQLGVEVLDAAGNVRPIADIIDDFNRALDGMGSGEKLEVIGRVFPARQAAGFAELLSQGGDRLREMQAALEDAGGTADRIAKTQLDTLQGDFTILKSAAEGLAIAVGEAFSESLRSGIRQITKFLQLAGQWVQENRELVAGAAKVILIVGAIGVGLLIAGGAIQVLAFAVGGLATLLSTAAALFGGLLTLLAAIASPIGLVVAGVTALVVAFVQLSGVGTRVTQFLSQAFESLRGTVATSIGAMAEAIQAGDLQQATKILWATLKLLWQQGVNFLTQKWIDFKQQWIGSLAAFFPTFEQMWQAIQQVWNIAVNFLQSTWQTVLGFLQSTWTAFTSFFSGAGGPITLSDIFFDALRFITKAWATLESAWVETTTFLLNLWTNFTSSLMKGWNTAQNFVSRGVLRLMALFDESLDVEAIEAELNAELKRKNAVVDSQRERMVGERLSKRQSRLNEIQTERDATLKELDLRQELANKLAPRIFDQQRKESDEALAKARREFEEAVKQARKEQPVPEVDVNGVKKSATEQFAGAGEALSKTADKVGVEGTFNAAAIRGLGFGSTADRTAKASEEVARNTKKLLQEAQHGGLVFS